MTDHLTRAVRRCYRARELTQAVMAPALGISRSTLADRLVGRSSWRWPEVVRLVSLMPELEPMLMPSLMSDLRALSQPPLDEVA